MLFYLLYSPLVAAIQLRTKVNVPVPVPVSIAESLSWVANVKKAFRADEILSRPLLEASECMCSTIPCTFDTRCANTTSDPYRGLGCNAKGLMLCRFVVMDCDGDHGNAEEKQSCFEDSSCSVLTNPSNTELNTTMPDLAARLASDLGCNATGKTNLRFCGFGPYTRCPAASPELGDDKGVPSGSRWVSDSDVKWMNVTLSWNGGALLPIFMSPMKLQAGNETRLLHGAEDLKEPLRHSFSLIGWTAIVLVILVVCMRAFIFGQTAKLHDITEPVHATPVTTSTVVLAHPSTVLAASPPAMDPSEVATDMTMTSEVADEATASPSVMVKADIEIRDEVVNLNLCFLDTSTPATVAATCATVATITIANTDKSTLEDDEAPPEANPVPTSSATSPSADRVGSCYESPQSPETIEQSRVFSSLRNDEPIVMNALTESASASDHVVPTAAIEVGQMTSAASHAVADPEATGNPATTLIEIDEEELIIAVEDVKASPQTSGMKASDVHNVLKEKYACTLSQVRKACSKATKRAVVR
jgi:hypothetical protein